MYRMSAVVGLAAALAAPVSAQSIASDSVLTNAVIDAVMDRAVVSPHVLAQRSVLDGVELRVAVNERTYTVQVLRSSRRRQLVFFTAFPASTYADFAADGVPDMVVAAPCAVSTCVPVRYLKPDLPDSLVSLPDSTVLQTYSRALHSLADALRVR